MASYLQRIALVALAAAASLYVLLILIGITQSTVTFDQHPVNVLPANHTVLVLLHPTEETILQWEPTFPVLGGTEAPPLPDVLAVVRASDATLHTVRFFRGEKDGAIGHIGLYSILASPEGMAMLDAEGERMSEVPAYRALVTRTADSIPWTIVQSRSVSPRTDAASALLAATIFQHHPFVAWNQQEEFLRIDAAGGENTVAPSAPKLTLHDDAIVTIAGSTMDILLEHTLDTLPLAERAVVEGRLTQHLEEWMGSGVSFEHDLLPLLAQGTALELRRMSSGELLFSLAGTSSDAAALLQTMDRLHESMRSTLPSIDVLDRTFDGTFRAQSIRSSINDITQETQTIGPWSVRSTRARGGTRGLFTATKGASFMIANDPRSFEESSTTAVHSLDPLTAPSFMQQTMRMNGWIDRPALRTVLRDILPFLQPQTLPPFLQDLPEQLQFTMQQERGRTTLLVKESTKTSGSSLDSMP